MKYNHSFLQVITLITCFIAYGCHKTQTQKSELKTSEDEKIFDMVSSEELIMKLTPQLRLLANEIKTGLPNTQIMRIEKTKSLGLAELSLEDVFSDSQLNEPLYISSGSWPVSKTEKQQSLPPWKPLQKSGLVWTDAKFGVLQGEFKDEVTFYMRTVFKGKAHDGEKRVLSIAGKQVLVWKKSTGIWKLAGWKQKNLTLDRIQHVAFEEVLDQAVPDKAALSRLRRSLHQEHVVAGLKSGKVSLPDPRYVDLFDIPSSFQYPAVSVVDVNGDGWDDLFVSSRWGAAQLLENQKNGTFKDVTIERGLMIRGLVNCALFVDFDNDGDKDLFVGRTQEPSLYFINDAGHFRDASHDFMGGASIYMAVSASAADINGDGLIDLYLCTYGPAGDVSSQWIDRYIPKADRGNLRGLLQKKNRYLDMPGPRNIVLMNRGEGKFERVTLPKSTQLWRNSFQAVWMDVDRDGDQDVYICNDFAPDTFLRNDTPRGHSQPVFTNAGSEFFNSEMMCFGMGASWGDYDNDGDFDLYVSNMYSKAGKRIISKLGDVDPRIAISSKGSFLYENRNGHFSQVAGKGEGQQHVGEVGWAFGGQFADFDNDGQLDLYVPSGYYSAPSEIATQVDL